MPATPRAMPVMQRRWATVRHLLDRNSTHDGRMQP
jgi:hypothetical protein